MIGVLGGMGPESTAYTYLRMVRYCQEKYGARRDSDYPPIIIYSMPIPDVVEKEPDAALLPMLEGGISKLKAAGADFCIIPCNSVQAFVPRLRKDSVVLSIIEETVKEATKSGILRWGLLGTKAAIRSRVYQEAFGKGGLEILEPSEGQQEIVTRAITTILSGKNYDDAREILLAAVGSLKKRGAEGVVLACTDLPIVIQKAEGVRLLDTADIIARAAVEYWRKSKAPGDEVVRRTTTDLEPAGSKPGLSSSEAPGEN